MKSLRQDVIGYIRKTYKDEIEHPWMRYPDYGVFRHKDNQKWYGLMMDQTGNFLHHKNSRHCRIMSFSKFYIIFSQ